MSKSTFFLLKPLLPYSHIICQMSHFYTTISMSKLLHFKLDSKAAHVRSMIWNGQKIVSIAIFVNVSRHYNIKINRNNEYLSPERSGYFNKSLPKSWWFTHPPPPPPISSRVLTLRKVTCFIWKHWYKASLLGQK